MRGAAVDSVGSIFYADSTWGLAGTDEGYIDEGSGETTIISGLNGPNELESGTGTAGSGADQTGCDVIYVTNYYAGNVQEFNTGYTTGETESSACGDTGEFGTATTLISGLTDPSGIALSPGESGLGGDSVSAGPTFISNPDIAPVPEPGTFALMIGSLLLATGIGIRAQRRQLQ
jgi:hypothetical protein